MLDDDGVAETTLPLETRVALYRHMRRLRRFDERMTALQRQGRIGFYGAATGQEAPPVAVALAARPSDWLFPALREGGALFVRGLPVATYLAQLLGCARDPMKGRQMPNHVASRSVSVVSWSSAIATQLPQAVGAAMAMRARGGSDAAVAFLGDGATSHPDFHAALNFAGVFRAPALLVCTNNQYALSVPSARQTASSSFAVKALAYGVNAVRVDGNDALAVFEVARAALERARSGAGATLVECLTYRLGAHSTSDDPSRYRDPTEVEQWQQRDPLERLRRHLTREAQHDAGADQSIDAELDREVDDALGVLEREPAPPLETLFEDVYSEPPWHLAEQLAPFAQPTRDVSR